MPRSGAHLRRAATTLDAGRSDGGHQRYDKLKIDFSTPLLPYSQPLDVSRSIFRHLGSCRFEAMRSFRRCITEFVFAPAVDPAGFDDQLWRYPVRIDIAMEYEEVVTSGKEVITSRDAEEKTKEAKNSVDEEIRRQRASQKQTIEQGLRNQYGPRARGLLDRIQSVVKKTADNPLSGSVRRATETQRLFPTFSRWLNQRFDEQWETTDVTSDISDYGTVQWNGRALEGIIVQLKIMQRNRILGLNKPGCFVFGEVDDVEFSMQRDLVDVECETSNAKLADWKARREFKSLWNAE